MTNSIKKKCIFSVFSWKTILGPGVKQLTRQVASHADKHFQVGIFVQCAAISGKFVQVNFFLQLIPKNIKARPDLLGSFLPLRWDFSFVWLQKKPCFFPGEVRIDEWLVVCDWSGKLEVIADWFLRWTADREVWVRALAVWARHLTLTGLIPSQEYSWVAANFQGNFD